MTKFTKNTFKVLLLFLIIISLYPGSLLGFFLYGDLGKQPDIIENPFGTTINHFVCYISSNCSELFASEHAPESHFPLTQVTNFSYCLATE